MNDTGATRGQTFLDDISVGTELGPMVTETSAMQLLEYAGASRDYNLIHHDRDFARASGLPDTIVQGSLKSAFLGHLVTDWVGELGSLRQLAVQYRGVDIPGTPLTAKGVVTRIYEDAGETLVDCEIWLEFEGRRNTRGRAVVSLPRRSQR